MARQHADDIQFRVKIDRGSRFRPEHRVIILGPYSTAGIANAQIARQRTYYGADVTGTVEVGQVIWTPVGEADDVVLISAAELAALKAADAELDALHAWGVDNWEGYGDALSGKDVDE